MKCLIFVKLKIYSSLFLKLVFLSYSRPNVPLKKRKMWNSWWQYLPHSSKSISRKCKNGYFEHSYFKLEVHMRGNSLLIIIQKPAMCRESYSPLVLAEQVETSQISQFLVLTSV